MLHCNMKLVWQSSYAPVAPDLDRPGTVPARGNAYNHCDHGFPPPRLDCRHYVGELAVLAKLIGCCGQRFSAACPASVRT